MKINKKQLRKLILKEVALLKEELKRPMQEQSPMSPDAMENPEVLLELLQSLKENSGILWENQQMIHEKILALQAKLS